MLAGGRFTRPEGCQRLFIATDHKSLLGILDDRALDTIDNTRIVKLKERTLGWTFEIIYVPGKKQAAADALSRRKSASLHKLGVDLGDMDHEEVVAAEIQVKVDELQFGDSEEVLAQLFSPQRGSE